MSLEKGILTVDLIKEVLDTQESFDSRISTKNLKDSKTAFIVEFFEWFNTLETFKNWKVNKGKSKETQLDELADMLAFATSIYLQEDTLTNENIEEFVKNYNNTFKVLEENKEDSKERIETLEIIYGLKDILTRDDVGLELIELVLDISLVYYSLDEVLDAYFKKMNHNHARQDGTVDTDKGYV